MASTTLVHRMEYARLAMANLLKMVTMPGRHFPRKQLQRDRGSVQLAARWHEFDYNDVFGMLQLCTFETVALEYSKFCLLFTEADFRNFGLLLGRE